ncbi:Mannose-1-phosphate guanyltransferase [Astathelohania contejeani]|uniref:mannose-1-phosphate guanylyltransferase n=1 Tax=Astathelohania contejeani TaxID=164912 RepID=A0ABQ7HZ43_9MICR|nr:Mannose-1-phosphate guanyltransferase [Thelohania contejeani]
MIIKKNGYKALILVGGYGTRLRPLTITTPKPLIPFANKPILQHQIEALIKAGVSEIILAVNYHMEAIERAIKDSMNHYNVNIIFSVEDTPLGTGGPLALAKKYLCSENKISPFFVLNSDVICDYPLAEMMESHLKEMPYGTILTTTMEDTTRYGVVVVNENSNKVTNFIEKPKNFIGNRINAGIYILDPAVLDMIEIKECSLEKEIFPNIVKLNSLFIYELKGYWMDIGQPMDYLLGQWLYLQKDVKNNDIDSSVVLGDGCVISKNVCIGRNTIIGKGVRIENSVIFNGCIIEDYAYIQNSMIGYNCRIGKWSHIINETILSDEVRVEDGVMLDDCKILPYKRIMKNAIKKIIM